MSESEVGVHAAASPIELEEDEAFFQGIMAEVETPLDGEESRAARQAILERLERHQDHPTQAELYELDRLALEMESDEEVIAPTPALYRRYCQERAQTIDPNDLTLN